MYPQMDASQSQGSTDESLLVALLGENFIAELRSRLRLLGSTLMWFTLANLMSLGAIWVSHGASMPLGADGMSRWADLGASAMLAIVFALTTPEFDYSISWRKVAALGALMGMALNIVFGGKSAILSLYLWEGALVAGIALRPVGRTILRKAMRSERIQTVFALLWFFWMVMTPGEKGRAQ